MAIRKISVGPDYKSGAMHYIIGQIVLGDWSVHLISFDQVRSSYKIHIENKKGEVLLWKEFSSTVPVCVEYNINI